MLDASAAAGVMFPTPGRPLQALSKILMPVYADALRFHARDDLLKMDIMRSRVTDRPAKVLPLDARGLFNDPVVSGLAWKIGLTPWPEARDSER